MKKVQTKIRLKGFFGLFAAFAMAIGVGVSLAPKTSVQTEAADTVAVALTFPDDNQNSNKNSGYIDTKTYKIGTNQWSIYGFNNNSWNNEWTFIRAGRKNNDATASIATSTVIVKEIAKVKVTVDSVVVDKVNSTSLVIASNSTFTSNVTTIPGPTVAAGVMTYDIDSPQANYFYKLAYDFASHSANGFFQVSKVEYVEGGGSPVEISSVSVSPSSAEIYAGNTSKLNATVLPADASQNVTWESDTPGVASVDTTGLVTAVGVGTAIITATSSVDTSKSDTATITVTAAPVLQSIYVTGTPTKLTYFAGQDFDPDGITVYAKYDKGDDVDVTDEATYSPSPLTLGLTSVTVTFNGKTTSVSGLTVTPPEYYEAGNNFNSYANEVTSGIIDDNWNWRGIKNDASTDTRTWSQQLRIYSKGEFVVEPSTINTDARIISIEFNAVNSISYSLFVGSSMNDLESVKTIKPTAGSTQIYEDASGFRYASIRNTDGTFYIDNLKIKYKEFAASYDDVVSLDSNFTKENIKVGESVSISPTISPATASQGFSLSTESDKIQIIGSLIKGVAEASDVSVEIKTVGKNASGNQLTKTITFDVVLQTTTVAEALNLPVGDTVYLVENAKVSDGYNTTNKNQIQLEDSVDPNETILLFQYDIQPLDSYNYIAGGTITFKAKIGTYSSKNQFIVPTIVSYTDRVEEFAASINEGDVEGQCLTRFAGYKTLVLSFTDIELDKFELSANAAIVSARARYLAWALHMGEKPFEIGTISQGYTTTPTNNNIAAIVIISVLGLTTLAGYYFFRKKKEA